MTASALPAPATPPAPPPLKLRLLRAWFAIASRVAPVLAERQAATLFLTPRRRPAQPATLHGIVPTPLAMEVQGIPLHGWRWGDAGPTVLLVHGWSGRAADMTSIGAHLATRGLRAIAFDMPAHGETPGRQTSLAIWMRLLPELGQRLGGLHAIVGHSFGGAATVLALGEGLDAGRAVLVAPATGPAYFMERMRAFIGLSRQRMPGMQRRLVAMVGRDVADFDADRVAVGLTQPALILHDPADAEVPFAHGVQIAQAWRGSSLVAIPGGGHNRILGHPTTLAQIADFIVPGVAPLDDEVVVRTKAAG